MSGILHVHPYSFPSTGHQLSHSLHFHPGSGCPDHLPSPSADECSTWAHAHTWLVTCRCSPVPGGAMEEPPGLTDTVAPGHLVPCRHLGPHPGQAEEGNRYRGGGRALIHPARCAQDAGQAQWGPTHPTAVWCSGRLGHSQNAISTGPQYSWVGP